MRIKRKILAKDIHVGMDLIIGPKGRRICEVHKHRNKVTVIYRDVDGFSFNEFGPRHRVLVRS